MLCIRFLKPKRTQIIHTFSTFENWKSFDRNYKIGAANIQCMCGCGLVWIHRFTQIDFKRTAKALKITHDVDMRMRRSTAKQRNTSAHTHTQPFKFHTLSWWFDIRFDNWIVIRRQCKWLFWMHENNLVTMIYRLTAFFAMHTLCVICMWTCGEGRVERLSR